MRTEVATKYANLEWLVLERKVAVADLFETARAQLRSAATESEARAAFDRLARTTGDGHVQFRWPHDGGADATRPGGCAALGFDRRMQGGPAASMMPGYARLSGGPSEFPAGTLQIAGHKVGVLKIGLFAAQGFPELCDRALAALRIARSETCDDACGDKIYAWVTDRMTRDLVTQLHAIERAGADVLLVDLVDNGGGSEWAEAAARMLTGIRLQAARLMFVRGEHWALAFEKREAELRAAAATATHDDQPFLTELADLVHGRLLEARSTCDSEPLWRGEKPRCSWLGMGFYATGLLRHSDAQRLVGRPWAALVYTVSRFDAPEGVWHGPLIVLINAGTGSAAAQFAAELQDNRAAVLLGSPAHGGCGYTDGGTPITLRHSRGVLELPDCARYRKDGSNEVMAIQPDILLDLRDADSPQRRGFRIAQGLQIAVASAISQARLQPP